MDHATMSQAFTLRAYRRVRTRCAVEYSINGLTGTGIMHDASLTGYRVVGDRYVVKGDTMSLRVYLPPLLIAIEITSARVQWVKGREFGLYAIPPTPSGKAAINAFISKTSETRHTGSRELFGKTNPEAMGQIVPT